MKWGNPSLLCYEGLCKVDRHLRLLCRFLTLMKQKVTTVWTWRIKRWNPTVITQRPSERCHAAVTAEALPLLKAHSLVGTRVLLARSAGAWMWRQAATWWAELHNMTGSKVCRLSLQMKLNVRHKHTDNWPLQTEAYARQTDENTLYLVNEFDCI